MPSKELGLDSNDPNVRVAVFGKQVEQFLETDIGKYLLDQAEHKATEAMKQLKNTAPWNRRKIQRLQNDIRVSEYFIDWLSESVSAGNQIINLLETDND
jgi:hypothetical protein